MKIRLIQRKKNPDTDRPHRSLTKLLSKPSDDHLTARMVLRAPAQAHGRLKADSLCQNTDGTTHFDSKEKST